MVRSPSWAVGAAILLGLSVTGAALAGPPTEQLRSVVDQVVRTLEDPALKTKERSAERRQSIRRITNEIFDWEEMAKQALGAHWEGQAPAARDEFVRLFRDLLERAYISQIEGYSGERITYGDEANSGTQATVRTKILTRQGQETRVDYRLALRGDRWLVHDVVIANVSLVGNYRAQFNEIIRASSYSGLVEKIKRKIKG
jgi:phospholipid transport system substrate-binding protein